MDPSALKLQVNHVENQENWVPGTSAARGTPNVPGNRPLFLGIPAPNLGWQNLTGTTAAGSKSPIMQAASLPGYSMPTPNAIHENAIPRAAPSVFMSRTAERPASPFIRPFYNLPAGCTQVPINILVFHKPLAGSGSRSQLPLSQSFMPTPVLPRGSQDSADGTSVQLSPNNFLSHGRTSNIVSSDMASIPPALATPDLRHAPTCLQQDGLGAEASKAGTEEASQLQQSSIAVIENSCTKPEAAVIHAEAEGMQGQAPQELTGLVAEGSTDDNMQKYQRMRKRPKTQISQNDRTLTYVEMPISGGEQIQTFNDEKATPGRKPKPRRKKHRPKVIREDRPDKTRKPAVATPKVRPQNQTVKRSYVRKKRSLSSLENSLGPVGDKSISSRAGVAAESSNASVDRRLQFEHKKQGTGSAHPSMANSWHHNQEKLPHAQSHHNQKLLHAQSHLHSFTESTVLQVNMENSGGLAFGLSRKLNEMLDEYICLPEATPKPTPEVPSASSECFSRVVLMDNLRELAMKQDSISNALGPDTTRNSELHIEERAGMTVMDVYKNNLELNNSNADDLQIYCSARSSSEMESTKSQMSKAWQVEKENHAQHNNGEFTLTDTRDSIILRAAAEMLAFCQSGGIKKRRSIRGRRISFVPIVDLGNNATQASARLPQTCMEALFESTHFKFMTKKRSRKARLHFPCSIETNVEHKMGISAGSNFSGGSNGSSASEEISQQTLPWIPGNKSINIDICCKVPKRNSENTSIVPYMDSLQGVASKLQYLNLSAEQVQRNEMHSSLVTSPTVSFRETDYPPNALVPYGVGVVVPYEMPLHLVKKQRPRAKVDLDFETTRVWNLLMGKAADPVDGTDVEKEKWWQQEREVFQGRANSFIARMRLVQGDRHFSPWKGSVVDSVVGVFLTQNVADHLSSSAFMALAASFPPKSTNNNDISSQENETVISMNAVEDDSILDFFNNGVRPDLGMHCEDLSVIYEKNCTEPKDNTSAHELIKGDNCSLYHKAPNLSMCNYQRTGIASKAQQFAEFSSTELVASFQEEIASSQSVLTSEIIQSRLSLGLGTNYAPGDFVGGVGVAASQEVGSSADDGNSPAGNNVVANDIGCQRIGTAARTDDVGQPGISSCSVINPVPVVSSVDHPQLDIREEPYVSSSSPSSSSGSASLNMKNDTIEKSDSFFMAVDAYAMQKNVNKTVDATFNFPETSTDPPVNSHCYKSTGFQASDLQEHESFSTTGGTRVATAPKADEPSLKSGISFSNVAPDTSVYTSKPKKTRATSKKNTENFDWDSLRRQVCNNGHMKERIFERSDSIDWEAVRCADVHRISHAIRERGMNNVLAERIQNFLNRLVRDHGSIDLEWLRDVPPDSAKDYLLSIRGLGLKSVECVRLLTLHNLAFPVDTNVGRICVRLGWVPIQPLPESLQLHLLELYPVLETIQKYLWPRLCKLDQQTLYELHYQMITFGKVFCTKNKPNCNACPMRSECKHFASAFASARFALPAPPEKSLVKLSNQYVFPNSSMPSSISTPRPQLEGRTHERDLGANNSEPIIEEPASPTQEECPETLENDIEDFYEDNEEIPTIKLNMEAFAQNLEECIKETNMDLQSEDIAKALVAISSEAASIPVPKLKNVHRLRTEHYVYELPDSHPLVEQLGLDRREPDDPSPYLLIIWAPDEIKETSKASKPCCDSQMEGSLCNNEMCHACVSERENQSRYVRGTILVPCRTAMRGSFPLNGTYFQVNEVFADHNSSHNPIFVPREQLWNLQRRMVYFGTSVPTIFRGLTTEEIQQCFWRGFVCVRGFDMETRAPKPLCPHLHLAASKLRGTRKTAATEQKL